MAVGAQIAQNLVRKPIGEIVAGRVQQAMKDRRNQAMKRAAKSAGADELWMHKLAYDLSIKRKLKLMFELKEEYEREEVWKASNELAQMDSRSREYGALLADVSKQGKACAHEIGEFIELELKSDLWQNSENLDDLVPKLNVILNILEHINVFDAATPAKDLVEALKELNRDELSGHLILAQRLLEARTEELKQVAEGIVQGNLTHL
ncbi:hypothetical protein DRN67_03260 [Candidatus Micrarchaeota archaeon]|nr:MAG: hypothetical protein DRN67_03260 [Candidatus Micrarchaeota archaeon]